MHCGHVSVLRRGPKISSRMPKVMRMISNGRLEEPHIELRLRFVMASSPGEPFLGCRVIDIYSHPREVRNTQIILGNGIVFGREILQHLQAERCVACDSLTVHVHHRQVQFGRLET